MLSTAQRPLFPEQIGPVELDIDHGKSAARPVLDISGKAIETSLKSMLETDLINSPPESRRLPAALMYDEAGLKLWNKCTYLPKYYLTVTEMELLHGWGPAFIKSLGRNYALIDLGSGNLRKVRGLLDQFEAMQTEVVYFAVDLSRSELEKSLASLPESYRYVRAFGLCGTFEDARLWAAQLKVPKCFLSLGATFGNDVPEKASEELAKWAAIMHKHDRMLLGMDGCKDQARVWKAYNDPDGVWHSFIRNGFEHSNKILKQRWYNPADWTLSGGNDTRPDRHRFVLKAIRDVQVPNLDLHFRAGDEVTTYPSYKYSAGEMLSQLKDAGFSPLALWKAADVDFVQYFVAIE